MKHLALATCKKLPNLDADDQELIPLFARHGISADAVIWNDSKIDWQQFDAVLMRSVWDYYLQPAAFRNWLAHLQNLAILTFNPLPLLHWNMEKSYLFELADAGVRIPKSIRVPQDGVQSLHDILSAQHLDKAVLKPIISASSYRTTVCTLPLQKADEFEFSNLLSTAGPLLVQEFCPEIPESGEWSLMYFDGKFSHAVLKTAKAGDFRVQEEYGGNTELLSPPAAAQNAAERIFTTLTHNPAYARVDGFMRDDDFVLMELELLEPSLFLRMHEGAVQRFVEAVVRRLLAES